MNLYVLIIFLLLKIVIGIIPTQAVCKPVASGNLHTCAIVNDGDVVCWGLGGPLLGYGTGETIGVSNTPIGLPKLPLGDRKAVSVDVSLSHSCALFETFEVICWGNNDWGQLGYGFANETKVAERAGDYGPLDTGIDQVVELAVGNGFTCLLMRTGTVKCFGRNHVGQLGAGVYDYAIPETPAQRPAVDLGQNALHLSAGGVFICAVLVDYSVRCWGDNFFGQLGLGMGVSFKRVGDDETPLQVPAVAVGEPVIAIDTGTWSTCVLTVSRRSKCWGIGAGGNLGSYVTSDVFTPGEVSYHEFDADVEQISNGGGHTCALLVDGRLYCFGSNVYAQLGLGAALPTGVGSTLGANEPIVSLGPVNVTLEENVSVVYVSTGHTITCVLLSTSVLKCWGGNSVGETGIPLGDLIGDTSQAYELPDVRTPGFVKYECLSIGVPTVTPTMQPTRQPTLLPTAAPSMPPVVGGSTAATSTTASSGVSSTDTGSTSSPTPIDVTSASASSFVTSASATPTSGAGGTDAQGSPNVLGLSDTVLIAICASITIVVIVTIIVCAVCVMHRRAHKANSSSARRRSSANHSRAAARSARGSRRQSRAYHANATVSPTAEYGLLPVTGVRGGGGSGGTYSVMSLGEDTQLQAMPVSSLPNSMWSNASMPTSANVHYTDVPSMSLSEHADDNYGELALSNRVDSENTMDSTPTQTTQYLTSMPVPPSEPTTKNGYDATPLMNEGFV